MVDDNMAHISICNVENYINVPYFFKMSCTIKTTIIASSLPLIILCTCMVNKFLLTLCEKNTIMTFGCN